MTLRPAPWRWRWALPHWVQEAGAVLPVRSLPCARPAALLLVNCGPGWVRFTCFQACHVPPSGLDCELCPAVNAPDHSGRTGSIETHH